MKILNIGKRTVKTAIAVVLSLFIGNLLNLNTPLFAGFSAIMVMSDSIYGSMEMMVNRILATLVGAFVAIIFVKLGFDSYFFMAIGIILIILLCNKFKWPSSSPLANIVFLIIIIEQKGGDPTIYAFHRVLDTFIGLIVGTLVNILIMPPHPLRSIVKNYKKIEKSLNKTFYNYLFYSERMNLNEIWTELIETNNNYSYIKEQSKFRLIKEEWIFQLTDVNDLLFEMISHMTVINNSLNPHIISSRGVKKIRRVFVDFEDIDVESVNTHYDEVYSYHIERIAELLLLIRLKMEVVYESTPIEIVKDSNEE